MRLLPQGAELMLECLTESELPQFGFVCVASGELVVKLISKTERLYFWTLDGYACRMLKAQGVLYRLSLA